MVKDTHMHSECIQVGGWVSGKESGGVGWVGVGVRTCVKGRSTAFPYSPSAPIICPLQATPSHHVHP